MKRIVITLLALLLVLSACGQAAPQPTTEITSEIQTENPATTVPFEPTSGESNEISWRTVDVNSAEGREITQWLAEQYQERVKEIEEYPTQFPMGEDKTLICRNKEKISLRDNKSGKETTLLELTYIGEETTPEAAALDEIAWKGPVLLDVIDERYFAYYWVGWEWAGETGVYDTKNMRSIPVKWDEKYNENKYSWRVRFFGWQVCEDALYLADGSHGEYSGMPHLMRVDLKALDSVKESEPLMATDVLEDIPGVEEVQLLGHYLLTDDERYYFLSDGRAGLYMFDLQQKELALRLPVSVSGFGEEESYWWPEYLVQRGGRVYWTNEWTGAAVKYLAEITLP